MWISFRVRLINRHVPTAPPIKIILKWEDKYPMKATWPNFNHKDTPRSIISPPPSFANKFIKFYLHAWHPPLLFPYHKRNEKTLLSNVQIIESWGTYESFQEAKHDVLGRHVSPLAHFFSQFYLIFYLNVLAL